MLAATARLLLTLLTACAVAGCGADSVAAAPVTQATAVVTDLAGLREYIAPIEAFGSARARESVFITSRVSGRVSRIFLTEGARAAKGDPLVLLEDDAERAGFRSAVAGAAEAQAQLERLESLAHSGLVSQYCGKRASLIRRSMRRARRSLPNDNYTCALTTTTPVHGEGAVRARSLPCRISFQWRVRGAMHGRAGAQADGGDGASRPDRGGGREIGHEPEHSI
jgi:hypothetical protein